jgi:hypothetical protein
MDTNCTNYSIDELIDVFELKKGFTHDDLYKSAKHNIEHLVSMGIESTNNNPLVAFITESYKRICQKYNFQYNKTILESLYAQQESILPNLDNSSTFETNSHIVINHVEPDTNKNYTPSLKGGKINPLRTQINKQILTINTKFRENYFDTLSTNYHYKLPNPIRNVVSMRLLSAEIPSCIYNISSVLENNEFTITTYSILNEVVSDILNKTIKVRDGKYSGAELEDYLNKHVFTSANDLARVACKYDAITCKFYFFYDSRDPSDGGNGPNGDGTTTPLNVFDVDFRTQSNLTRPVQLNFGWVIGYRNPIYIYNENYVTGSHVSYKWNEGYNPESTYNELATNYILLSIDDYNNNYSQNMYVPFQEGMMTHNGLIGKIQNTHTALPMITFNDCDIDNNQVRKYFGPVNIDKLHIELLDDMGRIIDINNSDYSFTLAIETLYDL